MTMRTRGTGVDRWTCGQCGAKFMHYEARFLNGPNHRADPWDQVYLGEFPTDWPTYYTGAGQRDPENASTYFCGPKCATEGVYK